MSKFNEFQAILDSAKDDFEKFYDKGNSAAGTRVRKTLQELSALCKDTRKNVTELKVARKESKG